MGWRWGALEETPGWSGDRGRDGKPWMSLYCGFLGKEQASQGRKV